MARNYNYIYLDVNRKGVTVSLGNGSAEIQQTITKDTLSK